MGRIKRKNILFKYFVFTLLMQILFFFIALNAYASAYYIRVRDAHTKADMSDKNVAVYVKLPGMSSFCWVGIYQTGAGGGGGKYFCITVDGPYDRTSLSNEPGYASRIIRYDHGKPDLLLKLTAPGYEDLIVEVPRDRVSSQNIFYMEGRNGQSQETDIYTDEWWR